MVAPWLCVCVAVAVTVAAWLCSFWLWPWPKSYSPRTSHACCYPGNPPSRTAPIDILNQGPLDSSGFSSPASSPANSYSVGHWGYARIKTTDTAHYMHHARTLSPSRAHATHARTLLQSRTHLRMRMHAHGTSLVSPVLGGQRQCTHADTHAHSLTRWHG